MSDIKDTNNTNRLTGTTGNDRFEGGKGNDSILGFTGNDEYLFNLGDGQDRITDMDKTNGNIDTITFGENIVGSDLHFSRIGYDLNIAIANTTDSITIKNYYLSYDWYKIEQIKFADGTVWDQKTIESQPMYISGAGKIVGTDVNEWIEGSTGKDDIEARGGNDIIDGRGGGDLSKGGTGSDIYIFNKGYGELIIEETAETIGNIDKIRFGKGINPDDVVFNKEGLNLIITIKGTTDKIVIVDYYKDLSLRIEEIDFFGGVIWNKDDINARPVYILGSGKLDGTEGVDIITGSTGDDIIYAYSGNDIIDGKGGNDYVTGSTGNDTYIFNKGYGVLTIDDFDTTVGNMDTIKFGDGILPENILFVRVDKNLEITIKGSSDKIIIKDYFDVNFDINVNTRFEKIEFANGVVWDSTIIVSQRVYTIGTSDDDILNGIDKVDIFDGLLGNDTFIGGKGNDIYIYNLNTGIKTIKDNDITGGNVDTIEFGVGIDPKNIVFTRVGDNLEISIKESSGKVIVENMMKE